MNSQLLLLLAILMPGAVVHAPDAPPPQPQAAPAPETQIAEALPAQNPFAADPAASLDGRRLFVQYRCAVCHGSHARGGIAPGLRGATWRYGDAPEALYASIAEGRRYGMPAWGTILPADDIWKLVAYIESLRGAHAATARVPPAAPRHPAPGAS